MTSISRMPTLEILRPNLTKIELNDEIGVWFSYETPIAFRVDDKVFISENVWSNTTGKHLNYIDGGAKTGRLKNLDFQKKITEIFSLSL